jgi:hypothetical protein
MTKRIASAQQLIRAGLAALLLMSLPVLAEVAETEEGPETRTMGIAIEATVVAVDPQTNEISLETPVGDVVTMTVPKEVATLENVSVGDTVLATFMSAMEAELREPTAEELAEPWAVIEEGGALEDSPEPAIGGARIIRAVCTIEGMNRALGTVTLKDSRGKLHLVMDVEPEKMEGVTLGQTVVVVYAEAMALTLERKAAAE